MVTRITRSEYEALKAIWAHLSSISKEEIRVIVGEMKHAQAFDRLMNRLVEKGGE